MRILMLAGAHSVHTQRWANALVQRGHVVILATCRDHVPAASDLDPRVQLERLPFSSLRSVGYFLNALPFRRIVRRVAPDVINVHYVSGYGTTARLAGTRNALFSVWGSDVYQFPDRSTWHRRIVIRNLKSAAGIASTSQAMASRVKHLLEDDGYPVAVTPFGVDIDRYLRRAHESSTGGLLVRFVSIKTLRPLYGFDYLVDAVQAAESDLKRDGIRICLDIFGEGPQRSQLESRVRELGLEGVVRFHGWLPHDSVPSTLSNYDVFVMPSLEESFGVSALEAMAMSVPVIVTNAAGPAEIVTDGVDGLVVPIADSVSLASAMCRLAKDPAARRRLGRSGRLRVEAAYDFSSNVDTLEAELLRLETLSRNDRAVS